MVDAADVGPEYILEDYESCSTDCFKNATCGFWVFIASERKCALKADNSSGGVKEIDQPKARAVFYGKKACVGKGIGKYSS